MTSYDPGGPYHGVGSIEAVLCTTVGVVTVARATRLRRQLIPERAVGDEVVRGLTLVTAFGQGPVRALCCYMVGEVAAIVTPETHTKTHTEIQSRRALHDEKLDNAR